MMCYVKNKRRCIGNTSILAVNVRYQLILRKLAWCAVIRRVQETENSKTRYKILFWLVFLMIVMLVVALALVQT